jgi:iron complex transport system ATP-binding protein
VPETDDRAVELRAVVARYRGAAGERRVLDGADLAIGRGEMVALLGRNGSGKTTLLRVVAGTVPPAGGEVRLFGRPASSWSRAEIARRVAVLPQSTELPEGFRVGEVVALGRIPHARRLFASEAHDHDAIAAALRDVDADDIAARPVSELSGGERQRVLVAMALAQEPELLLLDEPTVHLDLAHQLALLRVLDRLRRARGLTVLAVLHDLNLAAAFADRAVLLDHGRVIPAGTSDRSIDPDLVRGAFGVPVEEAITASGRRVLAPLTGATLRERED